jgi:hypothetical protein
MNKSRKGLNRTGFCVSSLDVADESARVEGWHLPLYAMDLTGCSSSPEKKPRIHVHVAHPDGEAKFWLTPVVHLATSTGLSPRQITDAQGVVQAHMKEIEDAWIQHFGG